MTELPTAAVLAHWRSAWFDMTWAESVRHVWTKQPEKMHALAASVQESGIREPVTLGTDGRVWDGHHRIAVACHLGIERVPVRFAALAALEDGTDGCAACGFPVTVHALWCPVRPGPAETSDDVMRQIHAVFDDPSLAWFAPKFWEAFTPSGAA